MMDDSMTVQFQENNKIREDLHMRMCQKYSKVNRHPKINLIGIQFFVGDISGKSTIS